MASISPTRRTIARAARWTARIIGTLIVALYVVFMIGEGLPPLTWPTVFLAVALAGFVAAWFHDVTAAALSLSGVGGFYLVEFAAYGRFPGGWAFPLMFVPGVLLVVGVLCGQHVEASKINP